MKYHNANINHGKKPWASLLNAAVACGIVNGGKTKYKKLYCPQ